jgi:hypothetical protein
MPRTHGNLDLRRRADGAQVSSHNAQISGVAKVARLLRKQKA